jgi:putative hydrolase of the HAD superfamily
MQDQLRHYRGIIFDLDGVIRHWGEDHLLATEAHYAAPRELILRAAFGCSTFEDALTGRVTADVWHTAARDALALLLGRRADGAIDDFLRFPGRIDHAMLAYIDRLRRSLRVGLLSNATTSLEAHLEFYDLTPHFDAIVNTARIGVAKPNPRAFLVAAERLGLPPDACLMTDDTPENVQGARTAGLTALQFTSLTALQTDLCRLGIDHGGLTGA